MNILVLSAGSRNKIIQFFKNALTGEGRVLAADASELASALYEADGHYIVPHIQEPGYMDRILDICRQEQVKGILSLIDPELGILAENEERIRAAGACVIGSSRTLCEMSLDKLWMYRWLREHHYPCAMTWADKHAFFRDIETGNASFPVVVKPVRGSASIGISQADSREEADMLFSRQQDMMIQEKLCGNEIGVDVYIDMISGKTVSIFAKRKIRMRAGETDKAVSFRDPELFTLVERFVSEAGYRGQIDIDLFENGGKYFISEVNPRFGGGYPLAYACGCDHMKMIVENLKGRANVPRIGEYPENVYMMKYNEMLILRK